MVEVLQLRMIKVALHVDLRSAFSREKILEFLLRVIVYVRHHLLVAIELDSIVDQHGHWIQFLNKSYSCIPVEQIII